MTKSLVIVESPAKAKTISKFLGPQYTVKASIGHVKDLPEKELGVDIENNFKPKYVVIKGKKKILSEIKEAAKKADAIYLAPDPDREGEAISWHIAQELKDKQDHIYRVMFNEITRRTVLESMKNPGRIDLNKVDAQQARRILDRLVGYKISPLLWKKVRKGLSAGRVQSVALRLICEREREIQNFVPEEYWSITAHLRGEFPPDFEARLFKSGHDKIKIENEQQARSILEDLEGASYKVDKIDKKERKRNPTPPFTTSTLQQEAARKLRFSAKKTMMIAQNLYEGLEIGQEGAVGLITYMRTDSTRVSEEAQAEARQYILEKYGKDYVPEVPHKYKTQKAAQEAHEAIRPTSVYRVPASLKNYLTEDQYKLYELIWNRFIASQMESALLEVTTVDILAGKYLFRATGSVIKFLGFMKIYVEGKDDIQQGINEDEGDLDSDQDKILPPLRVGEVLTLLNLVPKQHFTEPPPRYSEASLVKELEAQGIGRPSTYATILSTIQQRDYTRKEKGKFVPTELGMLVVDLLLENFPHLFNVKFTAEMEDQLDKIEEGRANWVQSLEEFYRSFNQELQKAFVEMRDVKKEMEEVTEEICEKCGQPMVIKWGRYGKFMACSGFPKCRNTRKIPQTENGQVKTQAEGVTDEKCEKCGSSLVVREGKFGRFLACSTYPRCQFTKPFSTGISCPEEGCNGTLVERRGRNGRTFYSCSNYPNCKYSLAYKPVAEPCPKCQAPFLIEKWDKDRETSVIQCQHKGCDFQKQGSEARNPELE
jgi:DNA topoisomerase-1